MPLDRTDALQKQIAANVDDEYYEEDEDEEEGDDLEESEDEGYNLTHFGISQALPVPDGPPDFSSGACASGGLYLGVASGCCQPLAAYFPRQPLPTRTMPMTVHHTGMGTLANSN